MRHTRVKELMTGAPVLISPESSLQEAARKMKEVDCGILPVGNQNDLRGVITDRDIIVRAIAAGRNPAEEKVAQYMTGRVIICDENDTLEEAADKMHTHQVSRLVVTGGDRKVAGILSFGSILRRDTDRDEVARVVHHAVQPVVGVEGQA